MDGGGALASNRCIEQDEHITNVRRPLRTWVLTVRASRQGCGSTQDGGCVSRRYHTYTLRR